MEKKKKTEIRLIQIMILTEDRATSSLACNLKREMKSERLWTQLIHQQKNKIKSINNMITYPARV